MDRREAFKIVINAMFAPLEESNPSNCIGAKMPEPEATKLYAEFGRRVHQILKLVEQAESENDYGLALMAFQTILLIAGRDNLWFARLINAFFDLQHGAVEPLLMPKGVNNHPPAPTTVWVARAKVAAALHLFVTKFGMKRKHAAKQIAEGFPELQHLSNSASLEKAIIAWRE